MSLGLVFCQGNVDTSLLAYLVIDWLGESKLVSDWVYYDCVYYGWVYYSFELENIVKVLVESLWRQK
jgi:hypothetical protein